MIAPIGAGADDRGVGDRKAQDLGEWKARIAGWRAAANALPIPNVSVKHPSMIMPQKAVERLYALTQLCEEPIISTEVGQHQMWAAQYFTSTIRTSGRQRRARTDELRGPAAHRRAWPPDALVSTVAGEATHAGYIQNFGTRAVRRGSSVIPTVEYGHVGCRQGTELTWKGASELLVDSLPDGLPSDEAYGGRAPIHDESELWRMASPRCWRIDGPVMSCLVAQERECCDIPSGAAAHDMIRMGDRSIGTIGRMKQALVENTPMPLQECRSMPQSVVCSP